jgi:hypothetical protein
LNQQVPQHQVRTTVPLNQKTIFITLSTISIVLVAVSFIGVAILNPYSGNPYTGDPSEATPTTLAKIVLHLDVIAEGSIPSWYSGSILLISAVLLLIIAIHRHLQQGRFRRQWILLSGIFLIFSLDEIASLHEGVSNFMTQQSIEILQLGWTIPAVIFVAVVGLWYTPFILNLPQETRRLFIAAALLYVTGALGLEIVERLLLELYSLQSVLLIAGNHLQDLFEMLGVSVFIYALLNYIRKHMNPLHLHVR